jgi:hypothetical protein
MTAIKDFPKIKFSKMDKLDFVHRITDDIDENFCLGKFVNYNIIIMKKNNYVNCTALFNKIKADFNTTKEFNEWIRNHESAINMLNDFSDEIDFPSEKLAIRLKGTQNIYVHPLLIFYITMHVSIKFYLYLMKNPKIMKKLLQR